MSGRLPDSGSHRQSGGDDPDAPGLRTLLTGVYAATDNDNPVFETLQDEVPPPVAGITEDDLGK